MSKPKQYKQGWTEFYKLRFKVTPDVLIPRPETELLVDEVLQFIVGPTGPHNDNNCVIAIRQLAEKQSLTILDLGTGSGNIAISIAKNLPQIKIIASDVSTKALKIARQNAKFHGVEDQITFIQSNLLSAFCHSGEVASATDSRIKKGKDSGCASLTRMTPNIIVTNLPYIPSVRIPYLDSSVKDFEPYIALDGGEDGFGLYRKLFQQIKDKDWRPRLIVGEIDYTHADIAYDEASRYFPDSFIEVKKDLAHKQRILVIKESKAVDSKI